MIKRLDTLWESGEWLNYRDRGRVSKGAATSLFEVQSRTSGATLGEVRWFAQWRRYVFMPGSGMIFDAKCLTELAEYCTLKTEQHKRKPVN